MISGWGRTKIFKSNILKPKDTIELKKFINSHKKIISRGLGRSYGFSSISDNVIDLSNFNEKKFKIIKSQNILECHSSYSIKDIIDKLIKKKFFIPVTSGTKYVTIGGAIASDIHGKNHHVDGSFCDYVLGFKIMLANGKIINCSRNKNPKVFYSTCGGMGLTGIIIEAKIRLIRIPSENILETVIKTENLDQTLKKFEELNSNKYIVAWIDTNKINKNLGRSIIYVGKHSKDKQNYLKKFYFKLPFELPSFFLNNKTLKVLSNLYYYFSPSYKKRIVNIKNFFYPLDVIKNWNFAYGKKGFVQIQVLLNKKNFKRNLEEIILFFNRRNQVSFLSTLKKMGRGNKNLLSFPDEGYTITFDIQNNNQLEKFYRSLEKRLKKIDAKQYLTKDNLMTKSFFKQKNKNLIKFIKTKRKLDPHNKFQAYQSIKLGIF